MSKSFKHFLPLVMFLVFFSVQGLMAQNKPDIEKLPEYVVVTAENTKLLGGIGLTIDTKKSPYKNQLDNLWEYLQSKNEARVRTITDLLNVMSELGYAYKDAFPVRSETYGGEAGDDLEVFGSDSKHRVNIVFLKK